MPYYVYAIYTDSVNVRQLAKFSGFLESDAFLRKMRAGRSPGDNYYVESFFGKDDDDAENKALEASRKAVGKK